jgi:hypothetical protein
MASRLQARSALLKCCDGRSALLKCCDGRHVGWASRFSMFSVTTRKFPDSARQTGRNVKTFPGLGRRGRPTENKKKRKNQDVWPRYGCPGMAGLCLRLQSVIRYMPCVWGPASASWRQNVGWDIWHDQSIGTILGRPDACPLFISTEFARVLPGYLPEAI